MTINPMMSGRTAYETERNVSQTEGLVRRAASEESEELREACEGFETIFVKMMLDSMRKTLTDDTLIPKNAGEKLFEDQLYDEYAEKISKTAGLGIADMMYQQLEAGLTSPNIDITT